jgi:D-serine deaminase-like pyridoxal phosphate-dependent protein
MPPVPVHRSGDIAVDVHGDRLRPDLGVDIRVIRYHYPQIQTLLGRGSARAARSDALHPPFIPGATGRRERSHPSRVQEYDAYRTALADVPLPAAFVDLDALEANVATVQDRAAGTRVRVASKSVRCRAILDRVTDADGVRGLMCYTGREAAHLHAHGFDDLLVAYPVLDRAELGPAAGAVADGADMTLMIDCDEHVERAAAAARDAGVTFDLCLDVDMSTEHLGQWFGVKRSGVRSPEAALAVAETIDATEGVELAGIMGYDAQIAGLPDRDPSRLAVENAVIRRLKKRSKPELRRRRQDVARALDDEHGINLVNGGGTGSVEFTVADPWVTEVTVGSGFYAPRLFDWYDRFQHEPAAGYAIEVTRTPDPDIHTCRGGGYVASGPPGEDKAPAPELPAGAELLDEEGAGEVQTPVRYDGPVDLDYGDPVVMRHAKAGELCRSFRDLHLVRGDEVVETVPTYRGDETCFL